MQEQQNELVAISQDQNQNSLRQDEVKTRKLTLTESEHENVLVGFQKNGRKYSVRKNRDRFFFPNEWMKFYDSLKVKQKLTFDILINTGCRFNEGKNIRVGDCDLERGNITLRVTKVKSKLGEKNPRPRIIPISTQFAKKLGQHIKNRKLKNEDYLDVMSRPGAHLCLQSHLEKVGIKDPQMISLHNIRKTHGNWLKALGIDGTEICLRLGHDMDTFRKHYGSPNIFNYKDIQDMRSVLGDLYQRR